MNIFVSYLNRNLYLRSAMEKQKIVISESIGASVGCAVLEEEHDKLFVLTDETTRRLCWPVVKDEPALAGAQLMTIGVSDENKTLESLVSIWKELQRGGATRHSLLVNLGGGMVTDIGGFAASTFKRGIKYVNVPTTLLSMVDASVGGKTGINFGGLKNEIGVFSTSRQVVIGAEFLKTLDMENILSGYAEMLKHGLISNVEHWAELLTFDFEEMDYSRLSQMLAKSIEVKERIVDADPLEQGLRKALNLGHTVGHAFESLALAEGRTVLHGYAVAWGLVCELYLSAKLTGFPKDKLQQTLRFIRENYGTFAIDCKEYDTIYNFMTHDKKNTSGVINFTLLGDVGDIRINQTATKAEITDMLDFFRES